MTNELDCVRGRGARWSFALGCARALVVMGLAPAGSGLGVGVGALLVAGALSSVALTVYTLRTWRHAGGDVDAIAIVCFATSVLIGTWFAVRPPQWVVAHGRTVRRYAWIGAGLAVAVSGGLQLIDRFTPPGDDDLAVGLFVLGFVTITMGWASLAAARDSRSFAAGLAGALWLSLVCSLVAFSLDLLAILAGFNLDVHMRHSLPPGVEQSPDAFVSKHIADHFAAAIGGFVRMPLMALVVGSLGAWVGWLARPRGPHEGREVAA